MLTSPGNSGAPGIGAGVPSLRTPPSPVPGACPDDGPLLTGMLARIEQGNQLLARLFPALAANPPANPGGEYSRAPFLVAPCEGARRLLITFGGNTGYLMLPPKVVNLPKTHLVAIRDPKRCFGMTGIPGLGATYQACLASLRALIAEFGVIDVYCTGVSAGGYPALRYALDLAACGVLAFSAPTTLDLADDSGAPLSRYPQLTALYRQLPDIPLDLARPYAATTPRPSAILLYSPSNTRDAWLANRMGGIKGVEINAVAEEAGHRTFMWMNSGDEFQNYLQRLMALRPVAANHELPTS
jgi:hypothetical protein